MRILYDGEIFSGQNFGGINTYFFNLWSRLSVDMEAMLLLSKNSLAAIPNYPQIQIKSVSDIHAGPRVFTNWLNQRLYQRQMQMAGASLMHPTYYSLSNGFPINKTRLPITLTVWDMIHELFPKQYDPDKTKAATKKKAIMSASAIICISENTKQDLMTIYNVPESKINVTLLAPGIVNPPFVKETIELQNPLYFLYVGGRKFHKNFEGLLKAFARVASNMKGVLLFVVGKPFQKQELKLIATLGLAEHVQHRGEVNDDDLATLYSRSLALVYPSFYEGFGIPPLEAMACGTVAIVANRSSIPEVVGPAALQFDPDINGDLEDKLLEVFRKPAVRNYYILAGKEWVNRFSWNNTADQTFQIYRKVGNNI